MTYEEAVKYLYGLINYEKINFSYSDLKLDRMRELVNRVGNPQNDFPSILVAGTKGKGSTAYFLERLFLAWGWKCGFYTKPHLLNFTSTGVMLPTKMFLSACACLPSCRWNKLRKWKNGKEAS